VQVTRCQTTGRMDDGDLPDLKFDDGGDPRRSYLICSIPRSGSTLLCGLLTGTGVAGAPDEFFNPAYMRVRMQRWGVETTDEFVTQLLARKTGPNGVFGVKAHWSQYKRAFGGADPRQIFPGLRLIYIYRRDRLRQAVSWARAKQTSRFRSDQRVPTERQATFNAEDITHVLNRIERLDELWAGLFDRLGVAPHAVVYEDLVADRDGALRKVLGHIGIEPPVGLRVRTPVLERQADALTEEWVERYVAETGRAR
jgi:LPS sulfotransferase NodH